MIKNFMAMPLILKLLVAVTVVLPAFCINSLFPHQEIVVFGQLVTGSEWWSSGAGLTTLITGGILLVAGLLMLGRSRYGRPMYISGWVVMSLSIPIITYLLQIDVSTPVSGMVSNLVITTFIGLYLYVSKEVKIYFEK